MNTLLIRAPAQGGGALAVKPANRYSAGAFSFGGPSASRRLVISCTLSSQRAEKAGAEAARRHPPTEAPPPQAPGRKLATNNIVPTPRLLKRTSKAGGLADTPAAPSPPKQRRIMAITLKPVRKAAAQPTAGAASLTPVAPSASSEPAKAAVPLKSSPLQQLEGAHRPLGMVVGSAWLLSLAVQLTGAAALTPLWLPVMAGGLLGGLATALHDHVGVRQLWRAPPAPLRVLITGGSSGVGKALAREFLRSGDAVVITSRSLPGAQAAVEQLREEVGPGVQVTGLRCDVGDPAGVDALMDRAMAALGGGLDIVINNAGFAGSFQSLLQQPPDQVRQVVHTNLLGSLLVTKAAMLRLAQQPGGGHIFNTEGAGSDGNPTPQYAAYGATKCAIAQLLKTLQHEAAGLPNPVGVHNLSPGMVLTPLLLEGATRESKQVFNILCEHPETVAAFLVPRVRSVVARGQSGAAIRYLTPWRVLTKFLAAPLNAGKYFDRQGRPVYASERERLLGAAQAKRTQRQQRAAARRSAPLQLVYSLGMALSFWLIVHDAMAHAPNGLPGQ